MFQPEVVDSVPAILWTADAATLSFTWVSGGAETILGYPREAWTESATFWRDHTHPDDRHLLAGAQSKKELEYRMIAADGRVVWLRNNIQDSGGEISGVMFDITAEHQAHEALARSEENYRRLVHTGPDAIGVHTKGRFVYVNPRFVEMFGAEDESELIGREVLSLVDPDYREIVRQRLVRIAIGDVVPITREKLIRLDGRTIDAEVMAIPVVFNGQPAVQVVARDITDRIRADERLELLAAGTNEAIWEGDYATNSFWTNEHFRSLFGTAPDFQAAQQRWAESLHPDDRETETARLKKRVEDGVDRWSEEYRIKTTAGEYIWVLDRGRRVINPKGQPVRVIGALLDVTPLREAEQKFRELSRAIAHDFNNVLMSIQTFSDVLARTPPSSDAATAAKQQIRDAVARGRRVTDTILKS